MPKIIVDLRANRESFVEQNPPSDPETAIQFNEIELDPDPTPQSQAVGEQTPSGRLSEIGPNPFFDVSISPLRAYYANEVIPASVGEQQMVIATEYGENEDDVSRRILSVHGNQYRLVTNREVVDAFEAAIERYNLPALNQYTVRNALGDDGNRMIRTYHFPNASTNLSPTLPVFFQIRLFNSYNGTWRAGLSAGAVLGTHNLVSQSTVEGFGKHTSGLNLPHITSLLDGAYQGFQRECLDWQRWANIPMVLDDAVAILHNLRSSDRLIERMRDRVLTEFGLNGSTALSFYRSLSRWAEDRSAMQEANADNAAVIQLNREAWVRRLLSCPIWLRLIETQEETA